MEQKSEDKRTPLAVGQVVTIYGKPISEQEPEGYAVLLKQIEIVGKGIERWQVQFPASGEICSRLVKASDDPNIMVLTPEYILQRVAEYSRVPEEIIKSKSRKRELVTIRHIAMYFSYLRTRASLKYIGKLYGGRDHSTVIYARQVVEDLMEVDKSFKAEVEKFGTVLI